MASVSKREAPELGRRVEASVWAAGQRARAEVALAEAAARRVRDDAEADRARVHAEAVGAGHAEGLGLAAATLAGAARARDALLAGAAREVAGIAVEVARRILRQELALAPEAIAAIAARALAEARTRRQVTLRVAPADLPHVALEEGRLAASLARGVLTLRGDPALAPGDVVVETEAGRVDARVEAQLAAFAHALAQAGP